MKNDILVSVAGRPGSGKSTVSQLIIEALGRAGIEAVLVDPSGTVEKDPYLINPELQAIRVASISNGLKVTVRQTEIQ